MAFRVYKPKNLFRVKAEQVTKDNLQEIAANLIGRITPFTDDDDRLCVEVPTFDGIMRFEIDSWIVRNDDNSLRKLSNEEFEKTYEVARNVGG